MLWPKTAEEVVVNSQSQTQAKTQLNGMAEIVSWKNTCVQTRRRRVFYEIEVDPVDGNCGSVGVRRDSLFDPHWWLRSGILCAATAGLLRPSSPVGVPFLWSRLGWRRVLG